MKIIYTENSKGINEDGSFQNPKYFERADKQATSVVIYGNYPEIKAAYEDLGVEVDDRELAIPNSEITVSEQIGMIAELKQVIEDAKAECEKLQVENTDLRSDLQDAWDTKDQFQAKLTDTEGQLSELQAENTQLKAKIAELEKATVKKPTPAESKAAKAAEEAKTAEQTKE